MFNVKEITEKILVYFRKQSKRYKQAYKAYRAIQKAKPLIESGSQLFLCVALAQELNVRCKEKVVKYIPEFNFRWLYENMPVQYRPNRPNFYR